jgi:carbon storage regulator
MLILTRRVGESIWIGNDVQVFVFASRGKQISLGIAAPPQRRIVRSELKHPKTATELSSDTKR